ncbi:hypothetical protein SNOG_07993 [Parastagonospora nodorum SN15]|uniref:Uncharacterized protein n=1 Tax=Phaeosphaeria nodorum (strain SN15 / ATCC MYA-4574 / FGSC 10173) TaxID=321614 RepID=Q0UJS1_PHANO|nr:hypothetical protein SNOG_07993 [Parastagonospora nodorum SN15]EAT84269.1 hypothetical protein SNOG_07993 [Parastagonospora nodorum SN15]
MASADQLTEDTVLWIETKMATEDASYLRQDTSSIL